MKVQARIFAMHFEPFADLRWLAMHRSRDKKADNKIGDTQSHSNWTEARSNSM